MVLVVLALWSLAANHCKLEQLTAFAFLQCSDDCASGLPHSGKNSDTDSCASVESDNYTAKAGQLSVPAPVIGNAPVALIFSANLPLDFANIFAAQPPPPELPCGWQFVFRTASPPRAPSFAS